MVSLFISGSWPSHFSIHFSDGIEVFLEKLIIVARWKHTRIVVQFHHNCSGVVQNLLTKMFEVHARNINTLYLYSACFQKKRQCKERIFSKS